ncbi:MAG: DUF523 domain-containing protein [Oscillospiraceae bacterium]|nr:DUF523 domain-containing protein [Oscillospiraceae bacterium]
MLKILVSACLIGCNCRYIGDNCKNEAVRSLAKKHILIPVCPEQLGGLTTPRQPSERQGEKVVMSDGSDVTAQFSKGAENALEIARLMKVDFAILKAHSPSCGKGIIYDGTFSGEKCEGNGVTAELLMENGIPVFTEKELDTLRL